MVDSHCHLADEAFSADRAEVIERARAAGLVEALCVLDATRDGELARSAAIATEWPAVRFVAGVHPHQAGTFDTAPAAAADCARRALLSVDGARGIGEIGLDYFYDTAPRTTQRDVFAAQVGLAAQENLPVVIHTRDADADTLAILAAEGGGRLRGVFHCFSGDRAFARAALDLGFFVSFSGIVSFPKAHGVHDAARFVPDDALLIETDCPYLAPVPKRGKRNEPAWVTHVADRLGDLRGTTGTHVSACATANYRRLFAP